MNKNIILAFVVGLSLLFSVFSGGYAYYMHNQQQAALERIERLTDTNRDLINSVQKKTASSSDIDLIRKEAEEQLAALQVFYDEFMSVVNVHDENVEIYNAQIEQLNYRVGQLESTQNEIVNYLTR